MKIRERKIKNGDRKIGKKDDENADYEKLNMKM